MKDKGKGFPAPKEHKEVKVEMGACCGEKYARGSNPESLKKAGDALSSYVKKNKMKY
jgi:hypothetical protein